MDKEAIHVDKEAIHVDKEAIHVDKEAIHVDKEAIHVDKEIIHFKVPPQLNFFTSLILESFCEKSNSMLYDHMT